MRPRSSNSGTLRRGLGRCSFSRAEQHCDGRRPMLLQVLHEGSDGAAAGTTRAERRPPELVEQPRTWHASSSMGTGSLIARPPTVPALGPARGGIGRREPAPGATVAGHGRGSFRVGLVGGVAPRAGHVLSVADG